MVTNISHLTGYYGNLQIKQEGGKYYCGIESFDGTNFKEVPEYLYEALYRFEKEREVKGNKDEILRNTPSFGDGSFD